ncbi:MAG: HU family DNA-binding protein [Sandaracinaceae bacterium]|nr:HU family DNA-binding protein [Sandaracinaceae bacterium]
MTDGTPKRMTKAQIVGELAEKTSLSKKQVGAVFEALSGLIKRELGRRGPGEFVIPDMLKLKVRKQAARKGAKVRIPSTGEIIVKDIPAKKKLRATPLKRLKDMVL